MAARRAGKRTQAGTNRFKPNYAKSAKPRLPLWTPKSGVTQSSLSKFLECPEQFALSYVEGITARRLSEPLEFGNLFHLCCEFQGKESAEAVAIRCTNAYVKTRSKNLDPSDHESLQRLIGLIRVIFPRYVKYYAKDDAKIKWISREKPFSVPYQFIDAQGKTQAINLIGKRDGVYRDTKGNVCLFETKTKSEIKASEISDGLRGDFQTLFYLLALMIELKIEPQETLYNVVRRPRQKMNQRESMKAYLDRVADDINKRPKHYFARWRVHLNKNSIPSFRQLTLDPTLRNLISWWGSIQDRPFERFRSKSHHLNLPALTSSRYGRSELYDLIIKKQRAGYFSRSVTFPELNESIKAA
jgi:hypothetical protein